MRSVSAESILTIASNKRVEKRKQGSCGLLNYARQKNTQNRQNRSKVIENKAVFTIHLASLNAGVRKSRINITSDFSHDILVNVHVACVYIT